MRAPRPLSRVLDRWIPRPIDTPGARWSVVGAVDTHGPSDALLQLALAAADAAREADLAEVVERCDPEYAAYVRTWPGEHYRLLAGVVRVLAPVTIVEIGTYLGHSALSLLAGSAQASVVTYDVVPWTTLSGTVLRQEDFGDRLEQRIGNLVEPEFLQQELPTLRSADLIFVDGPKDGSFEPAFVELVLPQLTDRRRVVIFDDTRLLPMVQLWQDLPFSRMDVTSLGHWSGTGVLETVRGD